MNRRTLVKGIILVAAILTTGWLLWMVDVRTAVRLLLGRTAELGAWGPVLFILVYVAGCVTMFPGILLTLSGGVLFGLVQGTLYVSIGATLGAALAFLVSRYLARSWVERKWGSNPRFQALDRAVTREGWKIVGLVRLSPVFPFTPTNFLFGLTRIPLHQFVAITWVSILPLTSMFVYVGTVIGDLTQISARPIPGGTLRWVITGIGLFSTVLVTFFVTRIARKALASQLPET